MKCPYCGTNIIKVNTPGGVIVCEEDQGDFFSSLGYYCRRHVCWGTKIEAQFER